MPSYEKRKLAIVGRYLLYRYDTQRWHKVALSFNKMSPVSIRNV